MSPDLMELVKSFIKQLFIIWSSTYAVFRIVHTRCSISAKRWLALLGTTILCAIMAAVLRHYAKAVSVLVIVGTSCFVNKRFFRISVNASIVCTCVGYGISFVFFVVGPMCIGAVRVISGNHTSQTSIGTYCIVGIIESLLTFALFRIKRLRNGVPFLSNAKYGDLGVYICICCVTLMGINTEATYAALIVFTALLLCGVALWLWWKRRIVEEYVKQVRKRERQELRETVEAQQAEIDALRRENEVFSAIIHKDNKLLPAMELAVREAAFQMARSSEPEERVRHADRILTELESVSVERSRTVRNYEHAKDPLPACGLSVLDSLLAYMYCRAKADGVCFDVRFAGPVSERLPKTIDPPDASTLLADLIENAIIAASGQEGTRRVFAELDFEGGTPFFRVSDTAPPIPQEVIRGWGVERITTRADSGGSGIGMMTTYELCKKYLASFSVNDLASGGEYTKSVCVLFDGTNQFFVGGTADNL